MIQPQFTTPIQRAVSILLLVLLLYPFVLIKVWGEENPSEMPAAHLGVVTLCPYEQKLIHVEYNLFAPHEIMQDYAVLNSANQNIAGGKYIGNKVLQVSAGGNPSNTVLKTRLRFMVTYVYRLDNSNPTLLNPMRETKRLYFLDVEVKPAKSCSELPPPAVGPPKDKADNKATQEQTTGQEGTIASPADLGFIKLCPKETSYVKALDGFEFPDASKYKSVMGYVKSNRPELANGAYLRKEKLFRVQAGENNSEIEKTVRLTLDIVTQTEQQYQRNIAENASDIGEGTQGVYQLMVIVKPQKRCQEAAQKSGTYMKLCVNQIYNDIPDNHTLAPSSTTVEKQINKVQGLKITNSNPAVVEAKFLPPQKGAAGRLFMVGLSPGFAIIEIEQTPAPPKGPAYRHRFFVDVKACDELEIYDRSSADTPQNSPKRETVPKIPSSKDPAQTSYKDQSSRPLVENGLARAIFSAETGNVVVSCPTDAQLDSLMTCSVVQDTPDKSTEDQYTIIVESTQVVVDQHHRFTYKIPSHLAMESVRMTLSSANGRSLGNIKIPIVPTVSTRPAIPQTKDFLFPKQCIADQPTLRFKGPFDGNTQNTSVFINGKPATIVAESAQSLIVQKLPQTPGPLTVELQEQGVSVTGQVHSVDVSSSVAPLQSCDQQMAQYQSQLYAMVDKGWKSPKPPQHGVWTAILGYKLFPNGIVQDIQINQSSTYAPLDQSAVSRVYQLQGQFPPLPACYDKPFYPVNHTFKVIYH